MACNLAKNCNFLFGFFTCSLPEDTNDVDLMVCTLKGIHTFGKHRNTQMTKGSPWGTKVKPFLSLQKKMMEYLRQRQAIANPFANRSYPSRPKPSPFAKSSKATPVKRSNLVTRPHKDKLSNPGRSMWDTILNVSSEIGLP